MSINDEIVSWCFARCETTNVLRFSSQRFRDSIEIFEIRLEKKFDQFFLLKKNSKNFYSNEFLHHFFALKIIVYFQKTCCWLREFFNWTIARWELFVINVERLNFDFFLNDELSTIIIMKRAIVVFFDIVSINARWVFTFFLRRRFRFFDNEWFRQSLFIIFQILVFAIRWRQIRRFIFLFEIQIERNEKLRCHRSISKKNN